ncbi:MAG: hypothetical protein ABR541_03605 [Candidatus Dormibacteria bacterium]
MARKRNNRQRPRARAARAGALAARPQRVEVVVPNAPGRTEPEPWAWRALFTLALLALLLQPLAGLLRVATVHAPLPVALLLPDQVLIVVAFPVAAPFAQRLAGAGRPLRFLESVSMGAIASLAYDLLAFAAGRVIRIPVHRTGIEGAVLGVLAGVEVVAFVVAAALFPLAQRYLLMPRRRQGQLRR